jgi:hypothetical protein
MPDVWGDKIHPSQARDAGLRRTEMPRDFRGQGRRYEQGRNEQPPPQDSRQQGGQQQGDDDDLVGVCWEGETKNGKRKIDIKLEVGKIREAIRNIRDDKRFKLTGFWIENKKKEDSPDYMVHLGVPLESAGRPVTGQDGGGGGRSQGGDRGNQGGYSRGNRR